MSHLRICIHDKTLLSYYKGAVDKWNKNSGEQHRDSGFDLYSPVSIIIRPHETYALDHQVSCAVYSDDGSPLPYYLYPRSSISKTPLRLANSVGIIDSGYRGHLIAKLDHIKPENVNSAYHISNGARLLQVCSHNLLPFKTVTIVDSLDETTRGSGGFGSTGK